MKFSTPMIRVCTVPGDVSPPIPPALDQLRDQPEAAPWEVPGLLERLAEVPDPRDPRGVRHALAVVLALTGCAVLAGARSLLAVGEWIADAPPQVLQVVGARPDPLLPKRLLPAESTVRRLLARIDGDALDQAMGRWLADRPPPRRRRTARSGRHLITEDITRLHRSPGAADVCFFDSSGL
ncbi:transposase family protein [Streptomyces sp. SLBN-118]|uniref:transposase family protein n=1 Tax=Streptomyces sp. SLBN-118 TaxID=2768454 RepID=UPI0021B24C65|nr:transposase family protein [Streptomyces sp. SLBN-118]